MTFLGRSPVLQEWFNEFCSPVVLTVATGEVENICLKNGLLLHELLGAFGHLNGLNSSIRISSGQSIGVSDGHIRFERSTEARQKPSNIIEEVLRNSFEECNLSRLPSNASELKASIPTSWNKKIEQTLFMRSLSFTEYEMISHPVILLSVVSSSDVDPLLCMQELLSVHHMPLCLSTGQYDAEIYRIYVVLHDINDSRQVDPVAVHRRLQSKFPPSQTRLLCINSLSLEAQNLQQPDMFSKYKIPLCFPQNVPVIDSNTVRPLNPLNGNIVIGSRLSLEDQISLRDFCVVLFQQDIIPSLERRISALTRTVSDSRKGMRNVLKSFWRKPRDESGSNSPVNRNNSTHGIVSSIKYKYDRSETQILLLADTSFIVGDYETAISMYKLVRDDYKSDRSILHLSHTYLMIAISYMIFEPQRLREIQSQLELLTQLFTTSTDPPHAIAYFALLVTEIYNIKEFRQYIDAAQFLLLAAGTVSRFPVLCALLTERAAGEFLLAGYSRRFVLHEILAGHKLRSVGGAPGRHAIMNFATAMIIIDNSRWGDMKAKLSRAIAQELKTKSYSLIRGEINSIDDEELSKTSQKSIVSLLQSLYIILSNDLNVGGIENINDASVILDELMTISLTPTISSSSSLATNNLVLREPITVGEGWTGVSTREILLNTLPISINDNKNILTEINDLAIPEINISNLSIVIPFNGNNLVIPWTGNINNTISIQLINNLINSNLSMISSISYNQAEEMKILSDIERQWGEDIELSNNTKILCESWINGQIELYNRKTKYLEKNYQTFKNKNLIGQPTIAQIPIGEVILLLVEITNKLPIALPIKGLHILINPLDKFDIYPIDIILSPRETKEICLSCKPLSLGSFSIDTISWTIDNRLNIKKSIQKLGTLLHKTYQQRVNKLRSEDYSMKFEVVPPQALLSISFEGISEEVLQGQLLKTKFILVNEGSAIATDIYLKLSQPCFVFTYENDDPSHSNLVDLWGQSCSLLKLPNIKIAPGEKYCLNAFLRLYSGGKQNISVLATYRNADLNDQLINDWRTSYVSVKTCVIPSVGVSVNTSSKPSSINERNISIELTNFLPNDPIKSKKPQRTRNSSAGQIDLSNDLKNIINNDSNNLDDLENSCQIEGIWLLGCAYNNNECKYDWKSYKAKSLEHLSIPIHVNITNEIQSTKSYDRLVTTNNIINKNNNKMKQLKGHSNWIIPLDDDKLYLSNILERFLVMSYTSRLFRKDIKDYAQLSHETNLESNVPKTISQVRKENRQKDLTSENDLTVLDDISLNNEINAGSKTCYGIPSTSNDLSSIQANDSSVMIIIVWKVIWQGKARLGMHHISDIPITLSYPILTNRPHRSFYDKIERPYSENLLVSITHESNVILPILSNMSQRGVIVPVSFELRSIVNYPMRVSVRAIEKVSKDKKQSIQLSSNSINNTKDIYRHAYLLTNVTSDESYLSVSRSSSRGMEWQGKTKYIDIIIKPFDNITLPFYVLISKSGIYDLKRFLVSVSSMDESNIEDRTKIYYKHIPGQSLIEVVDNIQ